MGAPSLQSVRDAIVALSPDLERYLREQVGSQRTGSSKSTTASIRPTLPAPCRKSADRRLSVQRAGYWVVGTVGRMEVVKDQLNFARALVRPAAEPEARRRMRLVLVGDGALRPRVESILAEGGVRDLAWLPGERADVPALLRGLDCFVLPSLAEGV